MHLSLKTANRYLQGLLLSGLLLASPLTLAKKDLFAEDPAHKNATQKELISAPTTSEASNTTTETPKTSDSAEEDPKTQPSFFTQQYKRLERHTKELFTLKKENKAHSDIAPAASTNTQQDIGISSTDAAKRAQQLADGKVINVKKYSQDNNDYYAVKLLQKNGRMKTITLDAISGNAIEEATPQPE